VLIRAGQVQLNGRVCRDPEAPTVTSDEIAVSGQQIEPTEFVYLMMNKPRGIITTASDEKGRATVFDQLPSGLPFLAPVGRLDKASEGLLLFTNDSEWAARITDPESHLPKTYHLQIGRLADAALLEGIRKGVRHGGDLLRVHSASVLRTGSKNSWLEIVLTEGRNRHIRRLFETLGIEVLRLVRVAIGQLKLGELAKGECRRLSEEEVLSLES
jgi:23S rRNA pseudouridine2605 synthase